MPSAPQPQAPPPRRRRRAPDTSVVERVLEAGLGLVHEHGLDAGLGGVGFEEAIRRSGVARATAYRRWPTREAFTAAVLVRLAREVDLVTGVLDDLPAIVADVLGDGSALLLPQGRRDVVVELFRRLVEADFAALLASPAWRTHVMLSAVCTRLPDAHLRAEVTTAIATSDAHRTHHRARVYARWCGLSGYRLVAPLQGDDGFRQMSEAVGAVFTGCLVKAQYEPALVVPAPPVAAFGASRPAPWTPQTYATTAVLLAHVEPDPQVVWDPAAVACTLHQARQVDDFR